MNKFVIMLVSFKWCEIIVGDLLYYFGEVIKYDFDDDDVDDKMGVVVDDDVWYYDVVDIDIVGVVDYDDEVNNFVLLFFFLDEDECLIVGVCGNGNCSNIEGFYWCICL